MNKTSSIESIPEDKRNVWDVILSETEQNDPLWCDIEGLISEIVFQKDGSGSRLDSVYSLTGLAIDPSNSNQSFRPKDDLYEFVSKRFGKEDVSQEELTGFLLSSLKDYEHIFASYLKEQVKKDDEYREKAHAHFAAIRDDCIEKSQQKNYGSSILNFNYTTPFMLEDPGLGIVGARNVHGILGRTETIFGIDGKDVPEDNPALSFTKDDMRKPLGPPPPRRSFFPRARGATMGFEYRPVR